MSLPFTILTCKKCEKKTATTIVRGLDYYVMEEGYKVMQDKELGWCHTCNDFAAIEVIPTMAELEAEAAEAEQKLNNHITRHDWLWYCIPSLFRPERMDMIPHLRKYLEEAQRRILWRQQRISPPRCQHCAGTDVETIIGKNAPHHRGCDGMLDSFFTEGFYLGARSSKMHFTPEGIFIETVDRRDVVMQ